MRNNEVLVKEEGLCHDCGKPLPRGKNLSPEATLKSRFRPALGRRAWYCQTIGLCRYCYRHKYPTQRNRNQTPVKPNGKRFLSWTERRYLERAGFNPEVWSPEFRAEMRDYWKARMRGEV